MHPTIWGAARKLWLDGHFRLAVQSAAETLISQLKTRTGLANMDATNVYEKVFNAKSPVLTWPGDPSDRTVSSMQNGLSKYAPGLNMTVRNTATHVASDEMTAQQALERLAALSLLAHWIDECEGPIRPTCATAQGQRATNGGALRPLSIRFYAHSSPSARSASNCSRVSLSRLALVLETHTPSFTVTGSVSPSTAIVSLWPRGTGRSAPSRATHWAMAASPRWKACCALLGPFAVRVAAGAGESASSGLTPSWDSRSCCSVDSCFQVPGCLCR